MVRVERRNVIACFTVRGRESARDERSADEWMVYPRLKYIEPNINSHESLPEEFRASSRSQALANLGL